MNTYTTHRNPKWWNDENDSAWERVKAAFKRDWDQTKHDAGGAEPDTDQQIGNTVRQAAGKESIPPRGEPTFDDIEPAYRFGYGAQTHYGEEYSDWNDELEAQLKEDWESTEPAHIGGWEENREAIRRGWDFEQ